MIYKVIPGPKEIGIKNGDVSMATNLFADIINRHAVDGWHFHSLETITTTENVGCLFNKQTITRELYMLIFCKEQ